MFAYIIVFSMIFISAYFCIRSIYGIFKNKNSSGCSCGNSAGGCSFKKYCDEAKKEKK